MLSKLKNLSLRIWRSGVRIAPGAPLFPSVSALFRVNPFPEIFRLFRKIIRLFLKFCQNSARVMKAMSFGRWP
jgi:hypothetical protein